MVQAYQNRSVTIDHLIERRCIGVSVLRIQQRYAPCAFFCTSATPTIGDVRFTDFSRPRSPEPSSIPNYLAHLPVPAVPRSHLDSTAVVECAERLPFRLHSHDGEDRKNRVVLVGLEGKEVAIAEI
jgi:hypothetical protein